MENINSSNSFTVLIIQPKYSQLVNNLVGIMLYLHSIIIMIVSFLIFENKFVNLIFGVCICLLVSTFILGSWVYKKIVFKYKELGKIHLLKDAIVVELNGLSKKIELSTINYVELKPKIGFTKSINGFDAIGFSVVDVYGNTVVDNLTITTKFIDSYDSFWTKSSADIFSYINVKGIRRF